MHKKTRPSKEKMTSVAPKGASSVSVDAETSEYKAVVIDNPGPSNQDTDTVDITLNQVEFPTCFLLFPLVPMQTTQIHAVMFGWVI